jgi:four helix bundle protein
MQAAEEGENEFAVRSSQEMKFFLSDRVFYACFPDKQEKTIMGTYNDLKVFNQSYDLARKIYIITKQFPKDEIFGLTSQIRRSSRSVCVNIVEAYRKKIYPNHFRSKISDADAECSETIIWLRMAKDFEYIKEDDFNKLTNDYEEVGRMLGGMVRHPEKFV